MDPNLLSALIAVGVSLVTAILHKSVTTPSVPSKTPAVSADPFAGWPGVAGHPALNLVLLPFLTKLLSGTATVAPASASLDDNVALSTLAQIIRSDPTTQQQLLALLSPSKGV